MSWGQDHRAALAARMPNAVCIAASLGDCAGRLQSMHFPLDAQLLKREWRNAELRRKIGHAPLERDEALLAVTEYELLADASNAAWGCLRHHQLIDRRLLQVPEEWLPLEGRAFAESIGLEHELDRLISKEAVPS